MSLVLKLNIQHAYLTNCNALYSCKTKLFYWVQSS